MQAPWLRSLIQKDSTCRKATRLLCHNYSAYATEPRSHIYLAYKPQLLKSACINILFHLLPSTFPSITVFSNESTCHIRWPKYWSFSISPSNEHSGSISLRNDWLDLLAVQETLNEPSPTPQFKSINSSLLSLLHGPFLTSVHNYCKIEGGFFSTFSFILEYSPLTMLWEFQLHSRVTQPHTYMYPFSPKLPSHPGCLDSYCLSHSVWYYHSSPTKPM